MNLRDQLQQTLGSAYTIERELGGGGMSRVFVARDETLARDVVFKVLPQELAQGLSAERFTREIRLAAALQEPHIVPVLSAGQTLDGLPYYTMPFVKGDSLRARMASGRVPLTEGVGILRDVARALAYAHENGVVHRDIKPENVLLSSGTAVVTDFGIAKALSASRTEAPGGTLTQIGTSIGTPAYMAPEQALGDEATDHRADLYAWGVMAYELLSGAHPFSEKKSAQALLAAHLSEVPRALTASRDGVPMALATLVECCLEKDPANRPQAARELVRALDALNTPGGGMLAPGSVMAASGAVPTKLGRGKVLVGAIVLLLVAAIGYWRTTTNSAATGELHAIAVLPFENASADTAFDYLAEGMSDEVRSQLTRTGLSVRSRASSQGFRGEAVDLKAVGDKLGVSEVVSGSVRQVGTRLRVTAELVRIADGNALWSLTFDVRDTSLANVQDSIARATVATLRVQLGAGQATPSTRGTADFEAYNAYLKGEYYRRRYQMGEAIALLREAVSRDPGFARAHASLASAYATLPAMGIGSADSARVLAAASVDRALSLDSTLVQTYIAKSASLILDLRLPEAEVAARRAVELGPDEPEAHILLAWALGIKGDVAGSLSEGRRARDLDPLSSDARIAIHYAHYMAHDYRASIEAARQTVALDPKSTNGFLMMGIDYALLGKNDSAVAAIESSLAIDPRSFGSRIIAAFVYAAAGRWDVATRQRALAEQEGGNSPYFVTMGMDIVFGDIDGALAAAERSIRAREPLFSWEYVACDPMYDPLKSKPRFVAMLIELGATPCTPASGWPISPPSGGAKQ